LKPRSVLELKRHLLRNWEPLGRLPIKSLTRAHVAARIEVIAKKNGPFAANHARMALSSMFTWALRQGLAENNPVLATHRAIENVARDRVLSDAELVAVWNACRDDDYGRIVKLLILTGQRRAEVGGIVEGELDLGARRWLIPSERTKNAKAHDVPLSDQAIEILRDAPRRAGTASLFSDSRHGFSGWSKAKTALDARATGVEPWRLHDLRRTAATRMNLNP
jgi:integrase